ncbi:MAG: hypothetical protein JWQ11_1449, partial [Rhizobacter sp.]|nr:hypothetical protein [Rhizobacter sp.]
MGVTRLSAALSMAVMAPFAAFSAHAQIVGNPQAPGAQRPTVLPGANGVPVVNIVTPSAAGVSRNRFTQFDVNAAGAVLNNSRSDVQTTIGGFVTGNPWLAKGTAKVILGEVESVNPSLLRGAVEVAGSRAEVVIANPAGISVDGASFINASHVTLTTGTPVLNGGSLEGYVVRGGTIVVDGQGIDLRNADYGAIYARAVQANARILAQDLTVVTGAAQVSADGSSVSALPAGEAATGAGGVGGTTAAGSPTADGRTTASRASATGTKPVGYALDVAALGGMYANKIFLIGTEDGFGARMWGDAISSRELVMRYVAGIENRGLLKSEGKLEITADRVINGGKVASGGTLQV